MSTHEAESLRKAIRISYKSARKLVVHARTNDPSMRPEFMKLVNAYRSNITKYRASLAGA